MTKDANTPTKVEVLNLLDASLYKGAKSSLEYAIPPQKVLRKVMLTAVCDLLRESLTRFPKLSDTNRLKMVDGIIQAYVREFTNGGSSYGPESKALFVTSLNTVFTQKEVSFFLSGTKLQETIKSIKLTDTSGSDADEWEE
jgi:hypothetical protein